MARVELKGVHRVVSKGRVYTYAWRGGPRLLAEPGTPEWIDELAAAHASRKIGDGSRVSGLCIDWKKSDAWTRAPSEGGLADSTKKNWRRWVDEITDHFGELRVKHFDQPGIRRDIKRWRDKWKDTPRAADMAKQVLSALLSYAVEEGKIRSNPCFGIPNLYHADRSEMIWTDDEIARLTISASAEVGYALHLACLTGLRQADLLKLTWNHVGEFAIELKTGKSGGRRTAIVPLHRDLRGLLDQIPKRAVTVLTNSEGHPWRSGFSSSWNKAIQGAGIRDRHFHDARGTFATKAYLANLSVREIAEVLGWSEARVDRIVNRYVRKNALLLHRIERLDRASTPDAR